MAKIDASKSAIDNLLALVNAANTAQTITNAQVTAGTPAAQTADGQGRNTNVQLSAVAGQGYTGNVTVSYARRGLNDSVLAPNFNFAGVQGQTASSIISAIAATNGLEASELHLEDPAVPGTPVTGAISNEPAHLNLVSATGSLLYIDGSSQSITFTWTTNLSAAVTTTALAGFDAAS
jgi:hypothetical protein